MGWSYGRELRLGYGYDRYLDYIYPFKCNPQEITVDNRNYFYPYVYDDNAAMIDLNEYLGLFLYNESSNYFNFVNNYDNNEYYLIRLALETKHEKCKGCNEYPENIPEYIYKIDYGIHIQFWIKKNKFLTKDRRKIEELLENVYFNKALSKLTLEQLGTKCEVLIYFKEEQWMTLKEVFEFFWDQQNIQRYQCVIWFWSQFGNNSNNAKTLTIKNKNELILLMNNLYIFIETIEESSANNFDIQVEQLNFDEINFQLEESKNEFKNIKEDDSFKMYQIIKKLFKCYQVYLDYVFKKRLNVDDENKETYEKWIQKLKMSIKNVNILHVVSIKCSKIQKLLKLIGLNEFSDKMEEIFTKIDYPYSFEFKFENKNPESIKEELQKIIKKFDSIQAGEYIEAYQLNKKFNNLIPLYPFFMKNSKLFEKINKRRELWEEKFKQLLKNIDQDFGFIESLKPLTTFKLNLENANYLIRKCPSIICNDNDEFRRWKCSICDEFMKIKTVECGCGYKKFEELNFYCEYYSKQHLIETLSQFKDDDENKNRQAKGFSYLLRSCPVQNFHDTLDIIQKYNITDEINQIVKNCFGILKIQKIIILKDSKSSNTISKIGYIKYLPVPQKLLNDNVKDVNYLMTKCPLSDECKDERFKLHPCFKCKKLTKIKTLKCNCKEEKSINSSHFICDNEQHRRQFDENVINLVIQQLNKYKDDEDGNDDIVNSIDLLTETQSEHLTDVLRLIATFDLDGDTKKFIDDYIANSKF